jgi:hypothetical protein
MGKNIDKRVWGVLGKQQTYFSPQKQVQGKTKTPLNANAFDSWDAKRSRFKRIDGYDVSDAAQQGGTVIGQSTPVPVSSPTPTPSITATQTLTPTNTATQTNTPTPSFTPTQTFTPTPTSTPYPLPSTPDLWYDSTNIGSIDYITSGGTDYVSGWRSIGTYQKYLTGTTTNTMPIWSASTLLPGNPKIVRFTKNATAGLQEFLSQRFDSTVITGTGLTAFYVIAKPTEYNYSASSTTNGFGVQTYLYSGNSTTGGFTPVTALLNQPARTFNNNFNSANNSSIFTIQNSGITNAFTYSYSATNLNSKFLLTLGAPYPTGFQFVEINQSGATNTTQITGTPLTNFSSFIIGGTVSSGGTITTSNAGAEVAEIMIYTRELTYEQRVAVQNYLRDKWRYDEWNLPNPVPTPTPTTPPFSPSGVTNLQYWFMSNSGASVSSWTNYGTLGGSAAQSVGVNQPTIITGGTLGTYTGQTIQFNTDPCFYSGNTTSVNVQSNTSYLVYKPYNSSNDSWGVYLYSGANTSSAYDNWFSSTSGRTAMNKGVYYTSRIDDSVNGKPYLIVSSASTSGVLATSNDVLGSSGTTFVTQFQTDNFKIGAPTGSNLQKIQIFEWLYYNRQLTSTENTNLINYLKTKYNYNTW